MESYKNLEHVSLPTVRMISEMLRFKENDRPSIEEILQREYWKAPLKDFSSMRQILFANSQSINNLDFVNLGEIQIRTDRDTISILDFAASERPLPRDNSYSGTKDELKQMVKLAQENPRNDCNELYFIQYTKWREHRDKLNKKADRLFEKLQEDYPD